MGNDKFWFNSNNNKAFELKDLKGLKSDDIVKKPVFAKLVNIFDANNDGVLDSKELESIFNELIAASGEDAVLSNEELGLFLTQKGTSAEIVATDIEQFIKALAGRETKLASYTTDDGKTIETEITLVDGQPIYMVKKENKVVVSRTEIQKVNETADNYEHIILDTKNSDGSKVTTIVLKLAEDGSFLTEDFITRITETKDGEKRVVYFDANSNKMVETKNITDGYVNTIYNINSIHLFDTCKDLAQIRSAEVLIKNGKEYVVQYDGNGNTITHARNGDSISRLSRIFGFNDEASFADLNPEAAKKGLKVGQAVVVPGEISVTDSRILGQGNLTDEISNYSVGNFKKEYLPNLDSEVFKYFMSLPGFELNEENIGMYLSLNNLSQNHQQKTVEFVNSLYYEKGITSPEEVKEKILMHVRITSDNGSPRPLNLMNEAYINISDINGSEPDKPISFKRFIESNLKLDITEGLGKELYEKLKNIEDPYILKDISGMFSHIAELASDEYKTFHPNKLQELANRPYQEKESVLYKSEYKYYKTHPPIDSKTAQEMYIAVINKLSAPAGTNVTTKYDDFITDNKDLYLREFAMKFMPTLVDYSDNEELKKHVESKSWLNPTKPFLKLALSSGFADRLSKRMKNDLYLGNTMFSRNIQSGGSTIHGLGIEYDPEKVRQCYEIMSNEESTEDEKLSAVVKAFGVDPNQFYKDIQDIETLSALGNMAIMMLTLNVLQPVVSATTGKLISGVSNLGKANAAITGSSQTLNWMYRGKAVLDSAISFGTWEALDYTVTRYTNEIDEQESYLDGAGTKFLHGAAFGAFAAGWGQLTNSALSRLFKSPAAEKIVSNAMIKTTKTFENTASFTSGEVLKTFNGAQAAATSVPGKGLAMFASEVVGFSLYDVASRAIAGEELGDFSDIMKAQGKNILTFKALGKLAFMHRQSMLPKETFSIKKSHELKIENKNGVFEVKYPDNSITRVRTMQEVVGLCNAHYENISLYEPLEKVLAKDKKITLEDNITIEKVENNYKVTFANGKYVLGKNLRAAMAKGQFQYQVSEYEKTLLEKGECELPNQQKIVFDKEANLYSTETKNGTKIDAQNVETLLQQLSTIETVEQAQADIKRKGYCILNNVKITKTEDGKFESETFLDNGEIIKTQGKDIFDVLSKSAEAVEHDRAVNDALKTLGLEVNIENLTEKQLKEAYRKLALESHTDKTGSDATSEQFSRYAEAKKILTQELQIRSGSKVVTKNGTTQGETFVGDFNGFRPAADAPKAIETEHFERVKTELLAEIKKDILFDDVYSKIETRLDSENVEAIRSLYEIYKNDTMFSVKGIKNVIVTATPEQLKFICEMHKIIKEHPEYNIPQYIDQLMSIAKEYKTPEAYMEKVLLDYNAKLKLEESKNITKSKLEACKDRLDFPEQQIDKLLSLIYSAENGDILETYLANAEKSGVEVRIVDIVSIFDNRYFQSIHGVEVKEALSKLINNEDIYKNPKILSFLNNNNIYESATLDPKEGLLNRINIANHILTSKSLKDSKVIMNTLLENSEKLLSNTISPEVTELKIKLLDKISNESPEKQKFILEHFSGIKSETAFLILDKVISNKDFYEDKGIKNQISEVYKLNPSEEILSDILKNLILFEQNPDMLNSKLFKEQSYEILRLSSDSDYMNNILKVLGDKNLSNNDKIVKNIFGIITTPYYQKIASASIAKSKIIDFLIENPQITKNDLIFDKLIKELEFVVKPDKADACIAYMTKIVESGYDKSEKLEILLEHIPNTITEINYKFKTLAIIDNCMQNASSKTRNNVNEKMSILLEAFASENGIKILEKLLSNPKLIESENFINKVLYGMSCNIKNNYNTLTTEGFLKLLGDENLCTEENLHVISTLRNDISFEPNENIDAFVFELLSNKNLSKDVAKNIFDVISTENFSEVQRMYESNAIPNECIKEVSEWLYYSRQFESCHPERLAYVEEFLYDERLPKEYITQIADNLYKYNNELIRELSKDEKFPKKQIVEIAKVTFSDNSKAIQDVLATIETASDLYRMDFPAEGIAKVAESGIYNYNKSSWKNQSYMDGLKEIATKPQSTSIDITLYDAFVDFRGKSSIEQLSKTEKKQLLTVLLEQKSNFVSSESNVISELIPIVPKNDAEYSKTVAHITNSLDIKFQKQPENVLSSFNQSIDMIMSLVNKGEFKAEDVKSLLPNKFKSQATEANIELLKKLTENPRYAQISTSDKKNLVIAALLNDIDKTSSNTADSAFDAYFIAKEYGLSESDATKIYRIIEASDLIDKFMSTVRKETIKGGFRFNQVIAGQERTNMFDLAAFKLKEGNNFELAQILYSAKDKEGLTRYLDKALEDRIFEIKSTDYVLPQTGIEEYMAHATMQTFEINGNKYVVPVVEFEDIEAAYAYIHTPETSFATKGSRSTNIAFLDSYKILMDEKVLCTDYISKEYINTCDYHGFIVFAKNENQYVANGYDMFSLSKNVSDMLVEYYRDRGYESGFGQQRYDYRTSVSDGIKSLMFPEYVQLRQQQQNRAERIRSNYRDVIKSSNEELYKLQISLRGATTESQKADIESKIRELEIRIRNLESRLNIELTNLYRKGANPALDAMNAEYIAKVDKVKQACQESDGMFNLKELRQIDPEFATIYEEYLKLNISSQPMQGLMRNDNQGHHNEALVGGIKKGPVFTFKLEDLPEEYFIYCKETGMPIVKLKLPAENTPTK